MDDLTIRSRTAMLDVLEALGAHRTSMIVIGAHAIHLQVTPTLVALAPFTRDSDLAIDPRGLADAPKLEDLMQQAGFTQNERQDPGIWQRGPANDMDELDLMVPELVSGPGRRGARIPPHGDRVARKTRGLEGVLVDHDWMELSSLVPTEDARVFRVRVAGPAASLVAKLFKLSERLEHQDPERTEDKDAHDVFRILIGTEPEDLRDRYQRLLGDDTSRDAATTALGYLRVLFAAGPAATGSVMAGRAEEGVGAPETVSQQVSILAKQFLEQVSG